MTAAEVCAYLSVTLETLGRFERELNLPTHRLGTGPKAQRRYYRNEVDAWVKSRWTANQPGQTA